MVIPALRFAPCGLRLLNPGYACYPIAMEPKAILLNAEEFRRAAIMLEGDQLRGDQMDPHVSVPLAVCNAFAAEMYLKFLVLIRTGKEARNTHNLRKLFNLLPRSIQRLIQREWENPPAIEQAIRAEISERFGSRTFDQTLDESADAFVEWRYHYEHKSLRRFSGDLMGAFRRVVFSLYPVEFADVRLPLPKGALSTTMQNVVRVAVKAPPKP
ncbi:MAG: hypothetical protein ACOC9Q_01850 [bacterium]